MANKTLPSFFKTLCVLVFLVMGLNTVAQAEIISEAQIQSPKLQREQLQATAAEWGLTKKDYQTYLKEMQNPRAQLWWTHLAPPQVLGMNATTKSERMKYAEIDVKLDHNRVSKEKAFQSAYTKVFNALYPDAKVIAMPDAHASSSSVLKPGDSLYLFTPIKNPEGDLMISKLLAQLDKTHRVAINIFFMGHPSYSDIQRWASANNIPKGLERNNMVTFNFNEKNGNNMLLTIVGHKKVPLPVVIRLRNGVSTLVSLAGVSE